MPKIHQHLNAMKKIKKMSTSTLTSSIIIYLLFGSVNVVRSANILVFAPLPFKSHFSGFQPLFKELANRGHNLTVVSNFPLKEPMENYTDIPIKVNKSVLKS